MDNKDCTSIKFAKMEFGTFLISKKIDARKFQAGEPRQYADFKRFFDQVHPNSFTQQKLFLINRIRKNYMLKEEARERTAPPPKKVKPKILINNPKLS